MTPNDLCTNALKIIGACAAGETPAPDILEDAYARLNRLLDLWALQRQTINGVQRFTKAVIAGHSPYTIGPGGDFNQARPSWIDRVTLALGTTPAIDLRPVELIGKDAYQNISAKTVQAQVAQFAYYDLAGPPTGNLYLWPVLNDTSVTISLWLPVAITQFTSQTQTITLLPGYQTALETNLAEVLLPELGRLDPPTVVEVHRQAAASIGWVKRANLQIDQARVDRGLLGPSAGQAIGDWYAGP